MSYRVSGGKGIDRKVTEGGRGRQEEKEEERKMARLHLVEPYKG